MLVKVENSNFVRDTNSMALINTDRSAREEYLNKVKYLNAQKSEINILKANVQSIQDDIVEIKSLLKLLITKE